MYMCWMSCTMASLVPRGLLAHWHITGSDKGHPSDRSSHDLSSRKEVGGAKEFGLKQELKCLPVCLYKCEQRLKGAQILWAPGGNEYAIKNCS